MEPGAQKRILGAWLRKFPHILLDSPSNPERLRRGEHDTVVDEVQKGFAYERTLHKNRCLATVPFLAALRELNAQPLQCAGGRSGEAWAEMTKFGSIEPCAGVIPPLILWFT
jgi:hypothetical protein